MCNLAYQWLASPMPMVCILHTHGVCPTCCAPRIPMACILLDCGVPPTYPQCATCILTACTLHIHNVHHCIGMVRTLHSHCAHHCIGMVCSLHSHHMHLTYPWCAPHILTCAPCVPIACILHAHGVHPIYAQHAAHIPTALWCVPHTPTACTRCTHSTCISNVTR